MREAPSIGQIMAHPRYREFAAAMTRRGRQLLPDQPPWSDMGKSDAEILTMPLRYVSGGLVEEERKRQMLVVIRAQERLVRQWWQSWEESANGRTARRTKSPAPEPAQGMLF